MTSKAAKAKGAERKQRMDTSSLMEQILSRDNLNAAYLQVVRNKGAAGVDGMTVEELGAYLSENVRGAILSVDKGQYEAAKMLGYNALQTSRHIVLPQAMRVAIPSFMNGFSSIIKETSIVSVLPVVELTKLGNQVYAKTYHPFEIYMLLGVIYFLLTYVVTFLAKWLERKASKWQN